MIFNHRKTFKSPNPIVKSRKKIKLKQEFNDNTSCQIALENVPAGNVTSLPSIPHHILPDDRSHFRPGEGGLRERAAEKVRRRLRGQASGEDKGEKKNTS